MTNYRMVDPYREHGAVSLAYTLQTTLATDDTDDTDDGQTDICLNVPLTDTTENQP